MKTLKLTSEEIATMSYADVANLILESNGKKMKIQDLFQKVIKLMQLPESYFESKIGDFFGLLSTDQRFTMLDKGFWDLSDRHSKKVILDDEEEEEEESLETEEDIDNDEETLESDEEVNYDDDTVDDDDEDDDLKDLVIMDDNEDTDIM